MIQFISKLVLLAFMLTTFGVTQTVAEDIKDRKIQQLETLLETYIEEIKSLKNEIKSLRSSANFQLKNSTNNDLSCKSNPNKCAPKELCSLATFKSGGQSYWMKGLRKVYSDAAKIRNLSCGVSTTKAQTNKQTKQSGSNLVSCISDPSVCSFKKLCSYATNFSSGKRGHMRPAPLDAPARRGDVHRSGAA